MERLTCLASTHSQAMNRLQSLEVQLEKSNNHKSSLEAREKKVKEDASQVSHVFCIVYMLKFYIMLVTSECNVSCSHFRP